jgi:hypothetical protein
MTAEEVAAAQRQMDEFVPHYERSKSSAYDE